MSERSPDEEVIFNVSVGGEGGVLKSICRYLMRYDLHKGMAEVLDHRQQIADLRETLGGVEAQVHELRNPSEAAPHPSPEVSGVVDSPEERLIRRLRDALHQYDEDTIPF